MPDALVYNTFASKLATLDGKQCGVTIFGPTYTPTASDLLVDDLTGEATVTRQTFDAAWDATNRVAEIAEADQWPIFPDSDGESGRWAVVYLDETGDADDGKVIAAIRYTDFTAADDWMFQPLNGFARSGDGTTFEARLDALEALPEVPDPTEGVTGQALVVNGAGTGLRYQTLVGTAPDPTDGTAGQVLTTNGTAYLFADAASGGLQSAYEVPIVADVADVAAAVALGYSTVEIHVTAETDVDAVMPDPETTDPFDLVFVDPTGACDLTFSGATVTVALFGSVDLDTTGGVLNWWRVQSVIDGVDVVWTLIPQIGEDQLGGGVTVDVVSNVATATILGRTTAGTGNSEELTASAVRALLDLEVGTDVQAYDADLAAIAGLTSAADKGIQFTGSGTAATFDLTAAGKALLDDASAQAQRLTLGISRPIPPDSVYTSGTNRGIPVTEHTGRGTIAMALGAFYGARIDVDGPITKLMFNVTATSLTAGQAIEIACFDIGADGLPTGTPAWTQSVAVGTTTGAFEVTLSQTLKYGQVIGILNPSSNAGTCTVSTCNPIQGFWTTVTNVTRNTALIAVSQGATMPDVSAYVCNNAGVTAEWTVGTDAPFIVVR